MGFLHLEFNIHNHGAGS